MLLTNKHYTDPKISPAEPKSADMPTDWYVWFRFFDTSKNKWIQKRFKKGINEEKNYKRRLAEANALKQVIKEELQAGWNPLLSTNEPVIVKIYSLEEGITYMLKIKATTLRTKSNYAYKYIMGLFTKWLTDQGLQQMGIKWFTPTQAQQYMDWLLISKQYSGRTFNDHLIVLRTFFNCFIEREWTLKNPFRTVKRKKQTTGRNLAFTDMERTVLAKKLSETDERMYFFTQFVFHCFIRRTELTTIKVKHVDLINRTIIIPGETAKNNTQESVVIPADLLVVLKKINLPSYDSEDYVFGRGLQTCNRQYKNPNGISERHNKIVKELGIDKEKGLYSWKHTGVCAYYYATNKDIYSVMRQLRHRDLNTTMIYLKSLGLIQNDAFKNAMVA